MRTRAESGASIRACMEAKGQDNGECGDLRSLRVLMLVENLSVPADRRVWQECLALRRAGYDVTVVCPRGRERERASFARLEGVDIHRYDLRAAEGGTIGYVREYASACRHTRKLALRLHDRRRFDVVHASNPPDLLLPAVRTLRRRGSRFVFDHHDLAPELYLSRFGRGRDPIHRALLALERMSFRIADVVISTNETYRRIAIERGGKAPADVFVVRNAPDPVRFQGVRPNPALKQGRDHLLAYVGVIAPQDGVDYALRALALLRERRTDWHAVFLGSGDALPDMERLTIELGLENHVEFGGWADDERVGELLSTADVGLAPDPRSPLNDASTMIKVAEYMSMALPVVAFDLPESVVTADGAALFAADNDEAAFAQRVDDLLSDPDLRARLGAAGQARIAGPLSWSTSVEQLLAAYRRVLARPSGSRRRASLIPDL
jgi:glycosyltransferase involved in cell wall biosynthesis